MSLHFNFNFFAFLNNRQKLSLLESIEMKDSFVWVLYQENRRRLQILLVIGFILSFLLVLNNKFSLYVKFYNESSHILNIVDLLVLTFCSIFIVFQIFKKAFNWAIPIRICQISVELFSVIFVVWSAATSCIEIITYDQIITFYLSIAVLVAMFRYTINFFVYALMGAYMAMIIVIAIVFAQNQVSFYHFIGLSVFTVLAIYISNALFNNRLHTFYYTEKIKKDNLTLDNAVRERTKELEGITHDLKKEIQARKQYEIQLKKEKQRAIDADKLKSAFLANMSHEIRTPLNGIIGFSQLLEIKDFSREKINHYISIIQNNSFQLLKIIDDVIDFSMIESNQIKLNYEQVNIQQIMVSVMEGHKNFLLMHQKNEIELICNQLEGDKFKIYTDRIRIIQVFSILLDNAFLYTQKGHVKIGYAVDGQYVRFYVEDTGVGIGPEKAEFIFERFAQIDNSLSRSQGGTGLGLAIARGITDILGGNIWLDKDYRKGARFYFTIPIKKKVLLHI